jgi:transposase-like protein
VNEKQSASQPKQRRRYYDEEFKRNAVELLERGERSAVQLEPGAWNLVPRETSGIAFALGSVARLERSQRRTQP